ncbi:GlxA family transcriptional regulator [Mesobaculum littorinae]|uniref:GlxA family transcriptional regulator n=1 Tax=Mesobaculum littorinae TaxID=2486419 RepID=A0A438AD13_9RHOB|nr:GlxA family transcriptional regulator [Mesobaculum littorinae]RVV96586.1 GlxA family transcriptional regulator [Mesobaculum littorinae]
MRAKRIGFLLIDGFALMSATSAMEPLRAANMLGGSDRYTLRFLSARGGWQISSVGGAFETEPLAEAAPGFDILFVVAGGDPLTFDDPQVLGWLRRQARAGVPLGGISGGAVILAKAGVLQSRRFTVHWEHLDDLRRAYPAALIERRLFVIDRDRYTCAGGMAALDMMHALITRDHGAALARRVSDWFIHTGIRGAEAPQSSMLAEHYGLRHRALSAAVELMDSHIADPLALEDLAQLSGIGTRQLERLAQEQLGQSVMSFYRQLRLDKADALLQRSNLPLSEVAQTTGFASYGHFSRLFSAHTGQSPKARRAQLHRASKGRAERGDTGRTGTQELGGARTAGRPNGGAESPPDGGPNGSPKDGADGGPDADPRGTDPRS